MRSSTDRADETDRLVKVVHEALGGNGWAYANYGNDELTSQRSRLEAVVQALTAELSQWRDISTAPKDGREVLLRVKYRAGIPNCQLVGHWMIGGHCIDDHPPIDAGWYFWSGLMFDKASEPTHWMPLPPIDAALSKAGSQ